MTIAVDWDVKQQNKQTNKDPNIHVYLRAVDQYIFCVLYNYFKFTKDLGQFPIQSAQILTACG